MVSLRDDLRVAVDALRAHKLRAALTMLGLTMGVTTLMTVMTLVQGANLYVEQKIANLGTNVFRLAKTPFAVVDFTVVVKSLKNKNIDIGDYHAVAELCRSCEQVGASASSSLSVQYQNKQTDDTAIIGYTPNMIDIDTRTLDLGRYFTPAEDRHAEYVCILGASLVDQFFQHENPIGRTVRTGSLEFTVIGTFQKLGSVLGQDQDNFVIIPLNTFLKVRGARTSLTLEIKASGGDRVFDAAQDEARVIMRSRRHDLPGKDDTFFIGTSQSYIALWQSISGSFFAVFVMVSSISAVVGGIVIMNVMLVSVTQRTREIGVRRAVGATKGDILRQFLAESLLQCLIGGGIGIALGFGCALALRTLTSFPASVRPWVAVLGMAISSTIGLFFGIYPAHKAANLDPVNALKNGDRMTRHEVFENMAVALDATIRSRKVRSGLTILGIVIGVTTVIAVASIIDGLNGQIKERVSRMGSNTLFITRIPPMQNTARLPAKIRVRKYLQDEDADFIVAASPSVSYATVFANRINFNDQTDEIRYGDAHVERFFLRGVQPEYIDTFPLFAIAQGRFISAFDEEHARDVVVIGKSIADSLFPTLDPLGKSVRLDGRLYEVIGVFEPDEGLFSSFGVNQFAPASR